jgi:hypothetical protein
MLSFLFVVICCDAYRLSFINILANIARQDADPEEAQAFWQDMDRT